MRIEPITCLRPTPEHVAEFASLPYDVFTGDEARAYVREHPTSFLAIDRPETGFPPDQDPYAPEVYAHASELLRERQLDRTLTRDETLCYYLYEQSTEDHRQMGLMCGIAVDDYLEGAIRQHELTLARKELDRVNHIKAVRAQTGPVFLAYRDSPAIDFILDAARQASPLYDFMGPDGVRQRIWRIARPVAVEAIGVAFGTIEHAYIADGHHRAAAAARVCEQRRAEGREDDPSEAFLAVLFPASQLRILPYDRIVTDTAGLLESELVQRLEDAGFLCGEPTSEPCVPQEKGTFGMYAFGCWRTLRWSTDDPELDVTLLQDHVLAPILGIHEPRTDRRISFAGDASPEELEHFAGASGVAFALFPTSLDELMTTADEGEILPPKSTWFDPKLLSGLAIRRIW